MNNHQGAAATEREKKGGGGGFRYQHMQSRLSDHREGWGGTCDGQNV